eukprot:scaffold128613_cov20-Tisochrysis_lutea.AAC.2
MAAAGDLSTGTCALRQQTQSQRAGKEKRFSAVYQLLWEKACAEPDNTTGIPDKSAETAQHSKQVNSTQRFCV